MRNGYLDTKNINMNEASMKEDHFYVMEYAAVLHDDTLIMIFGCCVNQNCQIEFRNIHKENVKQWLFIFDMGKIFSISFFNYHSISTVQ